MLNEATIPGLFCAELDGIRTNPRCTSSNCILAKPHFCTELGGVCTKSRCTRTHCVMANAQPSRPRRPTNGEIIFAGCAFILFCLFLRLMLQSVGITLR
jgi:hypothetical protein